MNQYRGKKDAPEQKFRRSETQEQQDYETKMLMGHYPEAYRAANGGRRNNKDKTSRSIRRKLTDLWYRSLRLSFPEALTDIHILGSVHDIEKQVKQDISDPNCFPETKEVAEVRRGLEISLEEKRFLEMRKMHVRDKFAKYVGLHPENVHPDDIPIIGWGGSGGGFRAMIASLGYMQATKNSGLWDNITYAAGVSGTCWALAAYYTFGRASVDRVVDNCKERFHPDHPLSGEPIRKLLTVPGGAYVTLGPLIQKHAAGLPMIHPETGEQAAGYHGQWYKWTHARDQLEDGKEPLPILTAVRHERPWKDWEESDQPFKEPDRSAIEHQPAKNSWFQWFEMTPFEVGCDELEAWVPTWGFGRPFLEGRSIMQLPEQSLSLILGLATSAPAGPLSAYIDTIKRNLPPGFIGHSIHDLASKITKFWGKQGTEEFTNQHPLHPIMEHNSLYHATRVKPDETRPPGIENSPRIYLFDSGMDNNCPTYVLLDRRRHIDVIINMDASTDAQEVFQRRIDQIASRREMKFTKRQPEIQIDDEVSELIKEDYAQIFDGALIERPLMVVDSYGNTVTNPPAPVCDQESIMVNMPLLPNKDAVPGFDPSTAKFTGSYNMVWTPEQIEMLMKVCVKNFEEGEETVKMALRDAWAKKKRLREDWGLERKMGVLNANTG